MSYNGWANWETWNVDLWISNDEVLYQAKQELVSWSSPGVTGEDVRQFVEMYMDGTTPDFEEDPSCELAKVDWEEIAENWNEEHKEEE